MIHGRLARSARHGLPALALLAVGLPLARRDGAPRVDRSGGYVGSDACAECHPDEHASWSASYHRTMTRRALPEALPAAWEGSTPSLEGRSWRLDREDGASYATPVTPDGRPLGGRREAVLVTGSHHYQVIWLADADGGLSQLPFVWHVAEGAWIPRKVMFLTPTVETTHPETGRWEEVCIKCHATHGTREPERGPGPTVAELGIACEACHGPGARHAELHAADDQPLDEEAIVDPGSLPHDRASQVCGQCHGILPQTTRAEREAWDRQGFLYRPGDELTATRTLLRGRYADNPPALRAFLDRDRDLLGRLFWPDGEVRASGREYNGLVESACFLRGELSCLTCHDLHAETREDPLAVWADDQLAAGARSGAACLACHGEGYGPEHTHHPPGSSGANCLECHMPYTVYGLTKAIRSHRIASPDAAAALATGRPLACNQCHLDRSLGWAAEHLAAWYGHAEPELTRDQREVAAAVLWALEGDGCQRALAAWSLGRAEARAVSGTGWMPPLLSTLLLDPYDAVRWMTQRTARLEPRYADLRLDFTADIEAQRNAVRAGVLADWQRDGLTAPAGGGERVLVRPDGTLDEARFRAIFARRDNRPVVLSE